MFAYGQISFQSQQEFSFLRASIPRSSLPDVLCKKSVLENFTKFLGKHLCQSLLLNKVAGLKSLRTPVSIDHRW